MRKAIPYLLQAIGFLTVVTVVTCIGLMAFAGYWMQVDDEPVKADYILPLAGDKNRFVEAVDLYKAGYAPAILESNAIEYPPTRFDELKWRMGYPNRSSAEINRMLLTVLGAQSAKLEPFGDRHISTVEEAEALKKHLNGRTPSLLIVTSPYHARRTKEIFKDVLPECDIRVVSTKEGSFDAKWWEDQRSAQTLVMEFAKTLHYMLGGAYRSTD